MAVIKRPGSNRWQIDLYVRDESGKRHRLRRTTGPGTSKKEALEIEKKLRQASDGALSQFGLLPEDDKKIPFSGFAKHWYDTYVIPNNKPSEQNNKEYHLRVHLVPFFQNTDLRKIKAEHVEQFKALKVKEGLNKKTVNNFLACLRKLLNCAVDWGYIDVNPMNRVKAFRFEYEDPDFYSEEDAVLFLETCKSYKPEWYPFFLTALMTGMRTGELCALKWGDIDFHNHKVRVRRNVWRGHEGTPKGRKSRDIPMAPILLDTLKSHRHLRGEYVFCKEQGQQLTRMMIFKPFVWLCRKAGLREIRLHDLRHTFASHLVMNGQPMRVVQELLGHKDITTTQMYAHLAPAVHKEAVATLLPKLNDHLGHNMVTVKITNEG